MEGCLDLELRQVSREAREGIELLSEAPAYEVGKDCIFHREHVGAHAVVKAVLGLVVDLGEPLDLRLHQIAGDRRG